MTPMMKYFQIFAHWAPTRSQPARHTWCSTAPPTQSDLRGRPRFDVLRQGMAFREQLTPGPGLHAHSETAHGGSATWTAQLPSVPPRPKGTVPWPWSRQWPAHAIHGARFPCHCCTLRTVLRLLPGRPVPLIRRRHAGPLPALQQIPSDRCLEPGCGESSPQLGRTDAVRVAIGAPIATCSSTVPHPWWRSHYPPCGERPRRGRLALRPSPSRKSRDTASRIPAGRTLRHSRLAASRRCVTG